ncbi:MAG: InlB B-repeat-containing protein, partial [Bacteroidales bacterium]|nr:InlB B-repeat-containing protein [Bacteroidales bacterium]
MKKKIIFVLTAAMLFFSQIMLSSCGDEEEDEPVQNNSGKNNYTVSYSSDFGVAPQSLTVKEGDELTSGDLKPLDTDGYIFLGWYNGSNQVEEGFVVKQDLKLVAKWTKDGVVYANELKDFLAKKTDDSKVYDVTISDLNPDMDVVVKALKDNPKIKVNLNLENCTELKDVKIMPDGGISKSKTESFLINLVSLTLPNSVVNIVLGCDG